jgi:hypothetical protein
MTNDKITNLASGTVSADAANYGQLTAGLLTKMSSSATLDQIATTNPNAANVTMGSFKITNLADGSSNTDAVNKG